MTSLPAVADASAKPSSAAPAAPSPAVTPDTATSSHRMRSSRPAPPVDADASSNKSSHAPSSWGYRSATTGGIASLGTSVKYSPELTNDRPTSRRILPPCRSICCPTGSSAPNPSVSEKLRLDENEQNEPSPSIVCSACPPTVRPAAAAAAMKAGSVKSMMPSRSGDSTVTSKSSSQLKMPTMPARSVGISKSKAIRVPVRSKMARPTWGAGKKFVGLGVTLDDGVPEGVPEGEAPTDCDGSGVDDTLGVA